MTTPSDKALVLAVFAGDKAAYETLYDRYAPLVRAVCYDMTGNLADAQDLAQDVFMRAYEKLDRLRDPELFGRWVVGIASRESCFDCFCPILILANTNEPKLSHSHPMTTLRRPQQRSNHTRRHNSMAGRLLVPARC